MKESFFQKKAATYIGSFICSLFWGLSFLIISKAVAKVEVIPLLAMRWTLSFILFTILCLCKVINVDYKGKDIRILLILGALEPCFYSIFETLGVKYTTASESSIMIATIPLMVIITGVLFLHRKVSRRTTAAIVVALIGVCISIVFSPAFSLGGKIIGYVALFIAVIFGGLYSHASSAAAKEFTPMESTMVISAMGAVFFNILNFVMGYGFSGYKVYFSDFRVFLEVTFLGICCSCICYILFNNVLRKLPPAIGTNLTTNVTTVVGIVAGIVFLDEPFGWFTVVGVALTITGICISSTEKIES